MHTRHSEVVYLDYHVVALCVLIVLARIVGAPTVYFSGSTRVFSIWLKFSILALTAILTDPGKKKSFLSEGFSDDSSSSSSTGSNSSNIGDNGSNEEGEIVRGAEPCRFEPLAANRDGAEADIRDDVLSSEQRAIDRF